MSKVSQINMRSAISYAVTIFLFLGPAVIGVSGCAETRSPAQEANAFFVAGKEAQYLGLQCSSSGYADLSAYDHLIKVQYPHTSQVEVLREPPSRRYQAFATLEYDPTPPAGSEDVVEGLKGKAREIGADAIILCPSGPDQGLSGITAKGKMPVVAIKYLE
jgi:hypothetical protein